MKAGRTENPNLTAIRRYFGQFGEAVKECERIGQTAEVVDFWFDYAFGATPSIFLKVRRGGNTFTERVRLVK